MISKYGQQQREGDDAPRTEPTRSKSGRLFLWVFSIIMVLTAGSAFLFKLIEFTYSFTRSPTVQFSLMPIMTYLVVAAGFACLFMWAYLSGQFKDVEAAKHRMLEMQDEIDAKE
jgi:cbb3-type cytochrome oxidase maturation protein